MSIVHPSMFGSHPVYEDDSFADADIERMLLSLPGCCDECPTPPTPSNSPMNTPEESVFWNWNDTHVSTIIVTLDDVVLFERQCSSTELGMPIYRKTHNSYIISAEYIGSCSRQGAHASVHTMSSGVIPRRLKVYFFTTPVRANEESFLINVPNGVKVVDIMVEYIPNVDYLSYGNILVKFRHLHRFKNDVEIRSVELY